MKINLSMLKRRCLADFNDFGRLGKVTIGPRGRHVFIDNGKNVLAVAHLDTVAHARHFVVCRLENRTTVFSEQLDDRLGAYILLDHLPRLGLEYDILLTEGEEIGLSTAADFVPPRQYNWAFSFDRMGTDVVMYQYDDTAMRSLLAEFGLRASIGSFSDICSLNIGAKAFNFGCGYYYNHEPLSHMIAGDTRKIIDTFTCFYDRYAETQMPHMYTAFNPLDELYAKYDYRSVNNLYSADGCECVYCGSIVSAEEYYFAGQECAECYVENRRESGMAQVFREDEMAYRVAQT